jgi:hypothetical protein
MTKHLNIHKIWWVLCFSTAFGKQLKEIIDDIVDDNTYFKREVLHSLFTELDTQWSFEVDSLIVSRNKVIIVKAKKNIQIEKSISKEEILEESSILELIKEEDIRLSEKSSLDDSSKDVIIKILSVKEEENCDFSILDAIESKKLKFTMRMISRHFMFLESKDEEYGFCIFEMEMGIQDLANPINFLEIYATPEKRVNVLILLCMDILKAFAEFNFEGGYFHADVKLDNIAIVRDDLSAYKYRPVLIDYGLSFSPTNTDNIEKNRINPGYITYSVVYRCPELMEFCKDTNCSGKNENEEKFITIYKKKYGYSKDFKEESFAVGVLLRLLIVNRVDDVDKIEAYDEMSPIRHLRRVIIPSLVDKDASTRKTTLEAKKEFENYLKDHPVEVRLI